MIIIYIIIVIIIIMFILTVMLTFIAYYDIIIIIAYPIGGLEAGGLEACFRSHTCALTQLEIENF